MSKCNEERRHSLPSGLSEDQVRELELCLSTLLLQGQAEPMPLSVWAEAYLAHYLTAPQSAMHRWLVDELQSLNEHRGRRHAIIAPRGSAKTTWISKIFPLYSAIHKLERYIILVSNTSAQAEKNLAAIRDEMEKNPFLLRDCPQATGRGPIWRNDCIETRNGVFIEALGLGSKLRGRTYGPNRPTLIVIDDIENDEGAESERQRDKAFDWLMSAVLPAGTDATNIFVLGTALHPDDMLQRLHKTPGWKSRTFRSLITEPERADLWKEWRRLFTDFTNPECEREARAFYDARRNEMDGGAVLLWPEREGLYELMSLRETIGEAAFLAEKQGVPADSRNCEWPDECFGPAVWFDTWPVTSLRVLALDPSKGNSETSDYSAYVMLGIGPDKLIYVEADLARRDVSKMIEDGLDIVDRFRPDAIIVETNQFQELIKDEMERRAAERNLNLQLYGVNNSSNKVLRIRKLTPYLRRNAFRFRRSHAGTQRLVDQLRYFPGGQYDDGPDALEMAVQLLNQLQGDAGPLFREVVRT